MGETKENRAEIVATKVFKHENFRRYDFCPVFLRFAPLTAPGSPRMFYFRDVSVGGGGGGGCAY